MAYSFGSLVFTPTIKAMQERYGSRPAYAKRETSAFVAEPIGPLSAVKIQSCCEISNLPTSFSALRKPRSAW